MKKKVRTIKQKISFKTSNAEIFDALMDSKKHAAFTSAPATISRKVGGTFSVFDGYAAGKNLELIKDKKIVQTWRASDWPDGIESIISFVLTPAKTGCSLVFTQKGIPSENYSSIKQGWIDFYWNPLKEMIKNR